MTTYSHYAKQPIVFDPSRTYEQVEPNTFRKPQGFWISADGEDDWPSWCRDEEFALGDLAHEHRVTLAERPNLLVVRDSIGMDALTASYAVQTDWDRRWSHRANDRRKWPIDWRQVASAYDGIIIAPYQYRYRNTHDWYYSWDCASGCIWNLDAIALLSPLVAKVGT